MVVTISYMPAAFGTAGAWLLSTILPESRDEIRILFRT